MTIYNFIYCFFYRLWEKKGGGRIDSSAHVLFAALIHILLIAEIVQSTTGTKILALPDYGGHGRNKYMYFLFAVPLWIGLCFYFNRKRTKRLLKEYHQKYGKAGSKNILRIMIYLILPTILLIFLTVVRQQLAK
jgi:hypothetical protein